MKFTEAMQKAFENPGIEFERKRPTGGTIKMKYSNKVVFDAGFGFESFPIDDDDLKADWQLVPKEVTWQEAIQANIDGKKVKHIFDNTEDAMGLYIERTFEPEHVIASYPAPRIKHGKWYIVE